MSPMAWLREYLIAKTPGAVWDPREDFAVRVCMRFGGAERLALHVVQCADAFIAENTCTSGKAKTLFFALEKTGDDKYRQAIQRVMDELNEHPEANDAPLSALYETLPFRMAYEMKINRMERVGQTAAAYCSAHQRLWDPKKRFYQTETGFSLRETAWFLMALTDGIALCSDQLYEHWRALVDIYRECLSGVLCRMNDQGLLTENLVDGDADPVGTAIVLWATLTGVEQGLIDPERYLLVVMRSLSALRECGETHAADMLEEVFGVSACSK